MKRKIAILLSAVMAASMLPMNVFAASENNVTKIVNVKNDDLVRDVFLKVVPKEAVTSGDSIILTVENAEFPSDGSDLTNEDRDSLSGVDDKTKFEDWKVNNYNGPTGQSWEDAITKYDLSNDAELSNAYAALLKGTNALPFKIIRNGKKEIQVKLFPISDSLANKDYTDQSSKNVGKPTYLIPLNVIAKNTGDVKVTINANETTISGGGTYTIANATSSSGDTVTTVDSIETFETYGYLDDIIIKESVKGTLKEGKVKLRLSGGFVFNTSKSFEEGAKIAAGSNASFDDVLLSNLTESKDGFKFGEDELEFRITSDMVTNMAKSGKACSIRIEGLVIEADDEDDDWGEVKLTVSGSGSKVSTETIHVATREDYGFKMTVTEDVPTILAGRFASNNQYGKTDLGGRTYYPESNTEDDDEDKYVAAEVKFQETIKDTWIVQRKLEFNVPEGVKITGFEFDDEKYLNDDLYNHASITNKGTTLKIDKTEGTELVDDSDCSEFTMKLYLSADADFSGDVTLGVSGAGLAEGKLDDVVIANVTAPITIETSGTSTNLGYQKVDTADITITEAEAGALFKANKGTPNGTDYGYDVVIAMDSVFGNNELGFADDNTEYVIDGDMEITDFDVKTVDGKSSIVFNIDKTSTTEPSSITLKNVKVGTTRSVPYGSFDLLVFGEAVVSNYRENADKDKDLGFFDTNDSYKFADYLTVKTETGTYDDVVKVTIGEKTILVNDEAVDMDVAPYIQATSNSTMVPLRFVALALGVDSGSLSNPDESSKVSWDPNTKTVTIFYGSGANQKTIQFTAGSQYMVVNGTQVTMENGVVAEIKDGRMFVPFRAIGTALGISVGWDADTRTATYNAQ